MCLRSASAQVGVTPRRGSLALIAVDKLMGPLFAALTLGLAPFAPEPHVVGKVRWVLGGAVGMKPIDWFDLLMHGAPWVWLAVVALRLGWSRVRARPEAT